MKALKLALCAATATVGLGMASAAWADDGPTVAYNLGVSNEYVFRGLSQTAGKPQFFAGVDVSSGMLYAGAWTSNVSFGDGTDQEVDLYGGFKPTLGALSFDIGVIYYGYISDPDNLDDYWEGKLAASTPVGPATLGAAVYYSPEFPYNTGHATYGEINLSGPVGKATVSGAVGYQDLDESKTGLNGYTTWNLGASFPIGGKLSLDVRYWDTDSKARDFYGTKSHAPFNAGASFVATVKASF
jgi:uncharacterized protein (TIGR02001 family)